MAVSDAEREQMARLKAIMEGKTPPPISSYKQNSNGQSIPEIELAGPGVPTRRDIDAMANVLNKLNSITGEVAHDMINESVTSPAAKAAISTSRNSTGVKVGAYQIQINEDPARVAGKQFYSIYHSGIGTIIADDVSLYETALGVVNLLNSGKYVNDIKVRELFEADNRYTSHYMDARMYKIKFLECKRKNSNKTDIFESRFQASLRQCLIAKKDIKSKVAL
jgi:hypothetical protein